MSGSVEFEGYKAILSWATKGVGMSNIPHLVPCMKEAFVTGRDRPPQDTDAASGHQYTQLLQAALSSRLSPEELAFMDACGSCRDQALVAARRDQLTQARQGFDEVWRRLRSAHLSLEGRLLVQTFLEPAEAYLYYKLQDYRSARALILHASALDHRLVTDFGYTILSAHRLQLGLNLMRIHSRLDERNDAVSIAAAFLDYLELREDSLPDTLACPRSDLNSVPDAILEYYFDKFCGELALVLAGSTDTGTSELFQHLTHHADPNACSRAGFAAHGHSWLYSKQSALRGEVEAFLVTATQLLQLGRMTEPLLWFATIIDVTAICRLLGSEGAELANWMTSEASLLSDAPWTLKHMACRA